MIDETPCILDQPAAPVKPTVTGRGIPLYNRRTKVYISDI
jgi:hypothetical protein